MISQKHKNLEVMIDIFDATRDGFLTADDFRQHANQTCAALRLEEGTPLWHTIHNALKTWWEYLHRDAATPNGRIPNRECVTIMENGLVDNPLFLESTVLQIAGTVFRVLDADGDNKIGETEYCQLYVASGLTAEIAINAFRRIDSNGDGIIELDEFVAVVREAFTTADPDSPGAWFFGAPANS
jgi:Ca2+-binding EF-hand superfamily protein